MLEVTFEWTPNLLISVNGQPVPENEKHLVEYEIKQKLYEVFKIYNY